MIVAILSNGAGVLDGMIDGWGEEVREAGKEAVGTLFTTSEGVGAVVVL